MDPRQERRRRRWLAIMVVSVLIAVGGGLLLRGYLLPDCEQEGCPAVEKLRSYRPPEPPQIYDAEGDLAGQLSGPRRIVVGRDSIPPLVREGYIAVEDRRFREHGGVDIEGAVRAFVRNITSGGVEEGASTITMQLARNVFGEEVLDYNRWHRKASEIRTAREIEAQLDKEAILDLYLNQIYLGDGVWGVETAARHYFGKPVAEVTPAEAAVLIGLAKNPEGYNPRRNPDRSRERRDLVLDLLRQNGLLDAEAVAAAKEEPIEVIDDPELNSWGSNAYYMSGVRRELRRLFPDPNERRGLRIYTGLDQQAQKAAVDALDSQIRAIESGRWGTFRHDAAPRDSLERAQGDSPYLQGMVVSMDVQTGLIGTLVGGRDYDHSEFDRAFLAERQPGSAFKPIVYLTALSRGLRPSEGISTDPVRLAQRGSEDWEPSDHTNGRQLTVRDALVYSSNTAAVRVGQRAGIDGVVQQAHAMGIDTEIPHYPSIFLGAAEVKPAQLVAAYATFGNGGHTVEPHFITRIEGARGETRYQRDPAVGRRVVDPRLGFIVLDMMRDVVRRGTGTRAAIGGPVAGKTGTTNDYKDAWFIGLTPKRVAGVWIGFDRPRTIVSGAGGGRLAAPVWSRFMGAAHRGEGGRDWTPPPGVVQVSVDSETGYRWSEGCRGQRRSEYFLAGTEPMAECPTWGPGWVRGPDGDWEYRGYGTDSARAGWSLPDSSRQRDPRFRTRFFDADQLDSDAYRRRRERQLDSMDAAWEGRRDGPPPAPARDTTAPSAGAPDRPAAERPQTPRGRPSDNARTRDDTGTEAEDGGNEESPRDGGREEGEVTPTNPPVPSPRTARPPSPSVPEPSTLEPSTAAPAPEPTAAPTPEIPAPSDGEPTPDSPGTRR